MTNTAAAQPTYRTTRCQTGSHVHAETRIEQDGPWMASPLCSTARKYRVTTADATEATAQETLDAGKVTCTSCLERLTWVAARNV